MKTSNSELLNRIKERLDRSPDQGAIFMSLEKGECEHCGDPEGYAMSLIGRISSPYDLLVMVAALLHRIDAMLPDEDAILHDRIGFALFALAGHADEAAADPGDGAAALTDETPTRGAA